MKRLLLLVYSLPFSVLAQQLPTQSLNVYDLILLNPGYSVSVKTAKITLHHRSQWVGFNEAPNTQTLTFVKRVEDKKLGLGAFAFNDRYGPFQRIGLNISGSYDLKLTNEFNIGLGLSGSLQQFSINKDKIELYHTGDEIIDNSVNGNVWTPNFAFGAFGYHDKFYVSMSVLNLLANDVKPYRTANSRGYLNGNVKNIRHLYIAGGYYWSLNTDIILIPNVIWDYVQNNPFHVQGGITARYNEVLDIGMAYSYGDAIILLAKVDFLKNWCVGYSFNFSVAKMRSYHGGSHEVLVGYRFNNKKKSVEAKPRFE